MYEISQFINYPKQQFNKFRINEKDGVAANPPAPTHTQLSSNTGRDKSHLNILMALVVASGLLRGRRVFTWIAIFYHDSKRAQRKEANHLLSDTSGQS